MDSHKPVFHSSLYIAIDASRKVLPLFSGAVVGALVAGPAGAVVGATLGLADISANYFGVYDKLYLAFGTIAVGVSSQLAQSLIQRSSPAYKLLSGFDRSQVIVTHPVNIFAFFTGAIVASEKLNEHLDRVATPIQGALYGYSYAGPPGAIAGVVGGVIDESLSYLNVTDRRVITTTIGAVVTARLLTPAVIGLGNALGARFNVVAQILIRLKDILPEIEYAAEAIGAGILAAAEAYSPTTHKRWAPIDLAKKIHRVYARNMDNDQLHSLIVDQALSTATMTLVVQNIVSKLLEHDQVLTHAFESFGWSQNSAWKDLLKGCLGYLLFSPFSTISRATTKLISEFFAADTCYIVDDNIEQELMVDDNMQKLEHSNAGNATDGNTLIKNRVSDVKTIADAGNTFLSEAYSVAINSVFGVVYLLSVGAERVIVYSMFYNGLTRFANEYLSTKIAKHKKTLIELYDQKTSLEEYCRVNADYIAQTNRAPSLKVRIDLLKEESRAIDEQCTQLQLLKFGWSRVQGITDTIVTHITAGYHLALGLIPFSTRLKVIVFCNRVSGLLSFAGDNAGTIATIEQSIARLTELQDRIPLPTIKSLPIRKYQSADPKHWLCFDNFTVGAGNKTLFGTPQLCLTEKFTAITGDKNIGKSMFSRLIVGLNESAAWGSGEITFYAQDNKKPLVAISSQHSNIAPYSTLAEVITGLPLDRAIACVPEISRLLHDLGINSVKDTDLSEVRENWGAFLSSGGVRKTVTIIELILKNPDVAILDETFAGSEHAGIRTILKVLGHELPNTKFLVVDHEFVAHTWVYGARINVRNGTLTLMHVEGDPGQQLTPPSSLPEDTCAHSEAMMCIGNAANYIDV